MGALQTHPQHLKTWKNGPFPHENIDDLSHEEYKQRYEETKAKTEDLETIGLIEKVVSAGILAALMLPPYSLGAGAVAVSFVGGAAAYDYVANTCRKTVEMNMAREVFLERVIETC
jgi:hypothetical protein